MILANLLADSEAEIICDLAQTYHITDIWDRSPDLIATLVIGLPEDSRLKKKYNNKRITLDQEILASILDGVALLIWLRSRKGTKKPESIYKILTEEPKQQDEYMEFNSIEDYEAWRSKKEEQWQCQKSQPHMSV